MVLKACYNGLLWWWSMATHWISSRMKSQSEIPRSVFSGSMFRVSSIILTRMNMDEPACRGKYRWLLYLWTNKTMYMSLQPIRTPTCPNYPGCIPKSPLFVRGSCVFHEKFLPRAMPSLIVAMLMLKRLSLLQEQPKEAQFPSGPWKLGGTRLWKLLPSLGLEHSIV